MRKPYQAPELECLLPKTEAIMDITLGSNECSFGDLMGNSAGTEGNSSGTDGVGLIVL